MHHKVAYLLEPRLPGGTSSAVAQELRLTSRVSNVTVFGLTSKMFSGESLSQNLNSTLQELGIEINWNPKTIVAEVVIIHNPAFLKFERKLPIKILANRVIVVTHENFQRPGGELSYDVRGTLSLIENATFTRDRILAPISPQNRKTVTSGIGNAGLAEAWKVLSEDWFNVCEFTMTEPTHKPKDRRGRLSRPGNEKFPGLKDLQDCFPDDAEVNIILGADNLIPYQSSHPHWRLLPFGNMAVSDFFQQIDFMVYFTSPTWRESFGRVIAEAISAGKVVISDSATSASFDGAVVSATPSSVSSIISHFTRNPDAYEAQVKNAQSILQQYSGDQFLKMYARVTGNKYRIPNASC